MSFLNTPEDLQALQIRDERLKEAIDSIGIIDREPDPDIFTSVVKQICAQQISSKAHNALWTRFLRAFNPVSPSVLCTASVSDLKALGIPSRKAQFILSFAGKVCDGSFDLPALENADDETALQMLTSLDGVGKWTAEMVLLFGMGRKNILSYEDFGIRNGFRLLYGLEKPDRKSFEEFRSRISPCGSLASLYLWQISADASNPQKQHSASIEPKETARFYYSSPIGWIELEAANGALTGLRFRDFSADRMNKDSDSKCGAVFEKTCQWLDAYFSGSEPAITIPLELHGTHFQQTVWNLLKAIPYGSVCSYKDIAEQAAVLLNKPRMSAQAAAGAVARNPISLIIPCHRVIGADGKLRGYEWGLERKAFLLDLEKQSAARSRLETGC